MKKLTRADIRPLPEYEKIRADFRRRVIELKKNRRIPLGDRVSLVFENRDSVILQIQEMMRSEHLYDEDKIQAEIDTYNALIPEAGELSATLFIEITEQDRIREILQQFQGIDQGPVLYLQIGDERLYGDFEPGHSQEEKISAVHYVRFRLSEGQQKALADPSVEVILGIEHPNYRAQTRLSEATRQSLFEDLQS